MKIYFNKYKTRLENETFYKNIRCIIEQASYCKKINNKELAELEKIGLEKKIKDFKYA